MARYTAGELLQRVFADHANGVIGDALFLQRKSEILRRSGCRLAAPIRSTPERIIHALTDSIATRYHLFVVALTAQAVDDARRRD